MQAASAIVMDMDTGAVLYGKSIYDAHYPASITKIMTLLVAVENGNLDDLIVFLNDSQNEKQAQLKRFTILRQKAPMQELLPARR